MSFDINIIVKSLRVWLSPEFYSESDIHKMAVGMQSALEVSHTDQPDESTGRDFGLDPYVIVVQEAIDVMEKLKARCPWGLRASLALQNLRQETQVYLRRKLTMREAVEEKDLIFVANEASTWCAYGEKKQLIMDICRHLLGHFDIRRRRTDA